MLAKVVHILLQVWTLSAAPALFDKSTMENLRALRSLGTGPVLKLSLKTCCTRRPAEWSLVRAHTPSRHNDTKYTDFNTLKGVEN